jgi:hypothetical protein
VGWDTLTLQATLASRIDIKMARAASASFDKFCREVELLLAATKPS